VKNNNDNNDNNNDNNDTLLSWQLEWINCLDDIDLNTLINIENIQDIDEDIIHGIFLLASSLSKYEKDNDIFKKIIIFLSNKIIVDMIRSLLLTWDGYKNPDILEWQAISRLSTYIPHIFIDKQQIYEKVVILVNIELKELIESNDSTWSCQTNPRFRRRLQNLIDILDNLYQKSENCLNCIINHSMTNIFQMIVRLERGLIQELQEISKNKRNYVQDMNDVDIQNTNIIIEEVKAQFIPDVSWTDRCLITLMNIFGGGLAKIPKCSALITLSEACAMLASPCWQYQLVSLKFIYAYLELDSLESQASSIRFDDDDIVKEESSLTNIASNSKSIPNRKKDASTTDKRKSISNKDKVEQKKRTSSVSTRRPGKATSSPVLMELCRSGFLRSLCWTALHSQILIREEAGQVFRFMIQTATVDQNSEFWVSIVEQGLVPLLEIISNGIYIASLHDNIPFPEVSVRDCAEEILRNLSSVLSNSSSFQGRIMNALVHTGSTKLRGNIFAGLIYLCARSDNLGKQLWSMSSGKKVSLIPQTSGGDMFLELCEVAYKDPSELLTIIKSICHATKIAIDRKMLIELQQKQSSPEVDESKTSPLGPTVLVNNEGQMIKMQCPSPVLIAKHSQALATLLQNALDEEKNITLSGNYYVWQEVLSHMTNDLFLEDNRVNRMSLDELLESLNIAYHYNMHKLLEKYSQLLSKRITVDTFVPILKCVLGIGNNMKKKEVKYIFHLTLGHDCLRFLSQNIDKVLNQRFPVRVNETIELLHKCLENLFFRSDD